MDRLPIFAALLASAFIAIGLVWDISWHRTIGRDTFWSPPHLLEQAGAAIAGLTCGYIALWTTFRGGDEARARSVRFWKFFYAPLGAWACIWGAFMIITSAPFDDWWHNAYGLDVKIISPPHMVLASGMIAIQLGAMVLALAAQNRARDESERRLLGAVFIGTAAMIVTMAATVIMEQASYANEMHASQFYRVTAFMFPGLLIAFARGSRLSWPATRIAIVYMVISLVGIWILQLVPATPKLAPIYNPVTHMVPPPFPLLLFAPAIFIDLMLKRFGTGRDWLLSVILGVGFVVVMLAVHWPWAEFMVSAASRNFFFGGDIWDYQTRLGPWRYQFWNLDVDAAGKWSIAEFAKGILGALVIGIVTSRLGLAWGRGLAGIKR